MLKFMFIIHALFILTGCGQGFQKLWVEPQLQDYVRHYLAVAPSTGYISRVATIKLGDPGDENDGLTTRHHYSVAGVSIGAKKRIVIRREIWGTPMGVRTLYHELGHALHNMEHTHNADDIMGDIPEDVNDEERQKFWEENLEAKLSEMFEGMK